MTVRRALEGGRYDFYTWNRGKHQRYSGGGFLITSSAQGRVFEVSPDGSVTFDFRNVYGSNGKSLVLSEARFLPVDYFHEVPECAN